MYIQVNNTKTSTLMSRVLIGLIVCYLTSNFSTISITMTDKNLLFDQYYRAANYLTAAQIFLKDNFLLERPLSFDDIKPRLLGHWGSGPGVNLAYLHLNYLAKKKQQKILFVLGPGHAFPALQANLFLEGTLSKYYPELPKNYDGIARMCQKFSWPYGFPSHSSPSTPGVILEGGELGYSLATAQGAALDNPDQIVACLIGDGEAETGPISGAWHINKLVNPRTNGVVLPILHLNGYKISGPTVFGRMTDNELLHLFVGYGYTPRIVSGSDTADLHAQMEEVLEWAHGLIQSIKKSDSTDFARLPMIIMRTPKGLTGVKELDGQKIEGNNLSHQTVLKLAKTDQGQLDKLQEWLGSYNIQELITKERGFSSFLNELIPDPSLAMGNNQIAHGGEPSYKPLILPPVDQFAEDATVPGTIGSSSMRRAGLYLNEVFKLNQEANNFRLFSPDETYSNKLDKVFETTSRSWQLPIAKWDKDISNDGRVLEILSEHNLQGLMQGYVLTGRHGVFASYEAFIQVVSSMMDQYAKFLDQAVHVDWRQSIPSFNYILTSSGWRQEHNGFSHQNPGFIDDALRRHGDFVDIYFPADGNTTLAALEHILSSTRRINILVAGKTLEPRWLTPALAKKHLEAGVSIWDFASDEQPDLVFCGVGDYMTKECLAAIKEMKQLWPKVKLRFVNILSLTSCGFGRSGACLTSDGFVQLFTSDKPVIINFHGYPETIKAILYDYISGSPRRFSVHGYIENGSTTTPFDMHVRNQTSRYHLAIEAFQKLASNNTIPFEDAQHKIATLQAKLDKNTEYIKENGIDMSEIENFKWTN